MFYPLICFNVGNNLRHFYCNMYLSWLGYNHQRYLIGIYIIRVYNTYLIIYRFGLKIVGQNTENNETASKEWNIIAQAILTTYYKIIYLQTCLGNQHHRLWSYHQIWDIQIIHYVPTHLRILRHMLNRGMFFLALIIRMATTRTCDCSHKRIKILSIESF